MPKNSFTNADLADYAPQPLGIATADPSTLRNIMPGTHKLPEPGDPDFDWATYDKWHAEAGHDPVTEAKATLARARGLSSSSGLDAANASNASLPAQTALEHQAENPVPTIASMAPAVAQELGSKAVHGAYDLASMVSGVPTQADIMQRFLGIGKPSAPSPVLEATREAISHPEEFGPAFLQGAADPHVTGAAAGDLALLAATANPEATAEAIGGTASGAARGVGGAIKNIGGGIAAGGEKLANAKIGGFGVPGAGILDAILQRNPWGLVAAATPYAVKGAGKLIEGAGGLLESAPTRLSDALKGITSSVSDAAGSMFEQPVTKPAGWTPRSVDITPEAYSAAKQGTIVPEAAPAAAAPSIRGLAAAPEAPTPGSMNAAPEPKQLGGITADDIAGYRQMVESGYHPDNAARLTVGNDPLAQETLKQQAYGVSDSGPLSPWAMQPRATFTNTPAGTAGPGAFAPGARPTASLDALTPEGPAFSLKDYTVAGEPAPTGRSGLQLQDSWKNYGGPSVAAKTQETLGDAVSRIGAKQTGAPPEVKVTAKPGEGAASDWTSQGGVDFYKGVPVSRTVNQEALDSIDRIRAGGTPSRLDAAVTGIKSPNLEAVYKGDEIAPHRTGDISVHRTLNDLRDQLKTATANGDTQAIDQLNRAVRQQQMLRRKATGKK